MAAIFVANGQGLMEVSIPSQKAVPAPMMNSVMRLTFKSG
jgi:hypothetical protein